MDKIDTKLVEIFIGFHTDILYNKNPFLKNSIIIFKSNCVLEAHSSSELKI